MARFNRQSLLCPLREASVEHLDIRMSHSLEHPSRSMPEELHGSSIVADNMVGHLYSEHSHSANEGLLRGHHEREICGHIFQVVQIQELGSLDVRLVEVEAGAIAFWAAHLNTAVEDLHVFLSDKG